MAYEFTEQGWREFTQAILDANGDQATLTSVLADMGDTFITGVNTGNKVEEENAEVRKENDRLKEANMSLFLRVGEQQKEDKGKSQSIHQDIEKGHNVDNFLTGILDDKKE